MKEVVIQHKAAIRDRHTMRLLIFCSLMFCMSFGLPAQQVEYDSGNFQGQWFIGLGIGPRIYFADHARQFQLVDRITGGGDLYVGKWFSPFVGARIGGSFQTLKGATQNGAHIKLPDGYTYFNPNDLNDPHNPPYYLAPHFLWKQQFDAWHLYGDILFDISNIFAGKNEYRFWTLSPFIGSGYMQTRTPPFYGKKPGRELSLNVGLMNSLHVSHAFDLNIDIRGAMVRECFKGETGRRPFDGILSVNLGATFRFGKKAVPKPIYVQEPVDTYVPVREKVVKVVTEWKDVATDVLILFQIGQSTLSRDAQVQLGFLARLMKEYPEGRYIITGYADEGTGNPDLNYRLSRERSERVKDCLTGEFGIAPSRLQIVAIGGIENRYYNDPSLSRSVIIRPDKY